jgi:hypothetical protein
MKQRPFSILALKPSGRAQSDAKKAILPLAKHDDRLTCLTPSRTQIALPTRDPAKNARRSARVVPQLRSHIRQPAGRDASSFRIDQKQPRQTATRRNATRPDDQHGFRSTWEQRGRICDQRILSILQLDDALPFPSRRDERFECDDRGR